MSPYQIRILLHYFVHLTEDAPEVIENAPILRETINEFITDGFLIPATDCSVYKTYSITGRGRCYCEGLCNVPYPVWTIPERAKVSDK